MSGPCVCLFCDWVRPVPYAHREGDRVRRVAGRWGHRRMLPRQPLVVVLDAPDGFTGTERLSGEQRLASTQNGAQGFVVRRLQPHGAAQLHHLPVDDVDLRGSLCEVVETH